MPEIYYNDMLVIQETSHVNVTGQEIVDAMRKNGYIQAHDGQWIGYSKTGKVVKACAMGQAVLNLGVDLTDFKFKTPSYFRSIVIQLNDHKKLSCKQIADTIEKSFPQFLTEKFSIRKKR